MNEETKTLDEQLTDWLKDHSAAIVFIAVGPAGAKITLDNFLTSDGLKLPAGWTLNLSIVETKR